MVLMTLAIWEPQKHEIHQKWIGQNLCRCDPTVYRGYLQSLNTLLGADGARYQG
jgi:hypothetical protein